MPRMFLKLDEAYVVDYPGDEAPLLAVGAQHGDQRVTAINWSKGVYFTSSDHSTDNDATEHAIPPRYLEARVMCDPPLLAVLTLADGALREELHPFRLATAEERAGA